MKTKSSMALMLMLAFASVPLRSQEGGGQTIAPDFFAMTVNGQTPFPGTFGITIGTLGKVPATSWPYVERTQTVPPTYNFKGVDNAIATAQANGVTSIIYTFYGVPPFYTTDPSHCVTQGTVQVCPGPPTNVQDFLNYVTALVTHETGKITYYEMWNEGNRTDCWHATQAELAQLQQLTYQTIKSIDPAAKILTPSPSIAPNYASWVQTYLADIQVDGTVYTDGVSWHGYHCADNEPQGVTCATEVSCDNNPVDCAGTPLINQIGAIRAAEAANGLNLPIFDTEGGWQQNRWITDIDDQVAYITRWYIIQASEGVSIATWYGWGTGGGGDPATGCPTCPLGWGGIFDTSAQQVTAAATAYQTVYQWLNGATMSGPCSVGVDQVWVCDLTLPNGLAGRIVWNGAETAGTYTPPSQFIQYETLTSTEAIQIPPGGTVSIGEQPIFLKSGFTPAVSLAPTSGLTYAAQLVGTASGPQTLTLTNTGSALLMIDGITVTGANSGEFAESNTCGVSVAAGANCTISVTFTPGATGSRSASIVIADNAPDSPQSASLSGTGVAPAVSLSPASLTYGSQLVGTTSSAQTVALTNTGSAPLNIADITVGADYTQTNGCGGSLGAGANCTFSITFTPKTSGALNESLVVTDNAAGSPHTVSLSGTGTAPAVSLSRASVTYSSQLVGTTSGAQSVTLTNTGSASLSITSIIVTGANSADFSQTNTCGTSLTAGANCTISVTFTPAATGSRTASVSIADNTPGSPQTVSLSGTGVAPAVSLSPASLTFATLFVGTRSSAQTLVLTNTGTASLTISIINLTGANSADFGQTNTCGTGLTAGANCTISVTFTPAAAGSRSALVSITDNAAGSPQTVGLSGTGTLPVPSAVSFNPASVTGGTSSTGTVSLNGPAPAGGAVVTLSSSNTSAAIVPASVTVAANATSASFTVSTSAVANTTAVTISATYNGSGASATLTVTAPVLSSLSLSPASVTGGTLSTGTVTLSSAAPTGGALVTLTSSNTSVVTVPGSVTIAAGATAATLTVASFAVSSQATVTISGIFNGTTQTGTLAVNAPVPVSLKLNPSSVTGGNASTAIVTLNGPAPAGGAMVKLASGNTAIATVPSTVTVVAGATTAILTVSTSSVGRTRTVSISATYNGIQKSTTLTITRR